MDYRRLSKTIAHALRHAPHLYELELDDNGWVELEALLGALRRHRREWREIGRADLVAMMADASKDRYELDGDRFRARYGHSTPQRLAYEPAEPPAVLYHGTAPDIAELILDDGLRPMSRQYVHLSLDVPTAMEVGHRKDGKPVLLVIDAATAHAEGVAFYAGNDLVWLADYIAPRFIRVQGD